MSGVLVDSDIIIDVLRQQNPEILENWVELADSSEAVICSPVSVAEVFHGMRAREKDTVEKLFSGMLCFPIDQQIGRRAGEYLRLFHISHSLALGDALIAATASTFDLMLWTRNRKHFPMKDLRFFAAQKWTPLAKKAARVAPDGFFSSGCLTN
jgi:predicted nucleic acid-binding protein